MRTTLPSRNWKHFNVGVEEEAVVEETVVEARTEKRRKTVEEKFGSMKISFLYSSSYHHIDRLKFCHTSRHA